MRAFVLFAMLAFLGGSQASLLDDLSAALTTTFQGVLDEAQAAAQNLVDTYVPVLGQAAQQLVGEAVQSAGQALTDLVSGKRKRQLQTEIGQIIHEGVQNLLEHTTQAIQGVQQALQEGINGLFGTTTDPAPAITTRNSIRMKAGMAKGKIMKDRKIIMTKLQAAVARMASARGFFDDLSSAVSTAFQPAIDAAATAFNQLVDGATAVGQQVVDHANNLITNLQTTVSQTLNGIQTVAQPYIDDANTIINSVTNHVQQQLGIGGTTP